MATRTGHEPEHYLVQRVRDHLARDPRVMELGVDVRVADGIIYVTGPVSTEERRDAVPEVVAEVVPDYEVRNQTTVGPFDEAEEAERLT